MDLSWSAGERVSGRYMARDRMSRDVGISWCRCSSSHCRWGKRQAHLLAASHQPLLGPGPWDLLSSGFMAEGDCSRWTH